MGGAIGRMASSVILAAALAAAPVTAGAVGRLGPSSDASVVGVGLRPASVTSPESGSDAPARVMRMLEDLPATLSTVSTAELGSMASVVGDLTAGPAVEVYTWNPEYSPRSDVPVAIPSGEWVSVLSMDGNPVGTVLIADSQGSDPVLEDVVDDASLASDLAGASGSSFLVHSSSDSGWYALNGGRVSPVDSRARSILAGSVPAETFLSLRAGPGASTPPEAPSNELVPPAWGPALVGGIVALVLAAAGLLVWILRPVSPEEDEPSAPQGMILLRRPVAPAARPPSAGDPGVSDGE